LSNSTFIENLHQSTQKSIYLITVGSKDRAAHRSPDEVVSMFWLQKLRLKVFALLVALTIAVITVVGMLSVPVLPAIGVALVAAVTMVNSMTTKLSAITCTGCGQNLSSTPANTYGITCQKCGTTTLPFQHEQSPPMYASEDDDFDSDSDSDLA
jgi:hypothetical protein